MTTWINLKGIMLSEISKTEKDRKLYDLTYRWNLQKWNSQRHGVGVTEGKGHDVGQSSPTSSYKIISSGT